MRYFWASVAISCFLMSVAAGWVWQRWLDTELSLTEYAALYAVRTMQPDFYREKLLPELQKAFGDNRLTHGELREIEEKFRGLGTMVREALSKPALHEELEQARQKGLEAGKGLGDSLGKALDDLSGFIQRKSEEFLGPQTQPEPPTTF